jgi:hypothetical protein
MRGHGRAPSPAPGRASGGTPASSVRCLFPLVRQGPARHVALYGFPIPPFGGRPDGPPPRYWSQQGFGEVGESSQSPLTGSSPGTNRSFERPRLSTGAVPLLVQETPPADSCRTAPPSALTGRRAQVVPAVPADRERPPTCTGAPPAQHDPLANVTPEPILGSIEHPAAVATAKDHERRQQRLQRRTVTSSARSRRAPVMARRAAPVNIEQSRCE